ncbi:MAG TPA: endonuclease/exonuclease/phosphatase family protein [Kiritimatiellia bacterium]|nr:endonuclease/exonuclease/phosphatase family protein [Kiritimatiellia bacterium]
MKTTRWIVVLALLGGMFAVTSLHAAKVKVVALNIEWFPGQKWTPEPEDMERHMGETAETLRALAPEILVATEICDADAFRTVLRAVPGLNLRVISNFTGSEEDSERRNQQIALATMLPTIAGWAEPWKATVDGLRRGFSFAAIENPFTGRLIMLYGLHLKSNLSNTPEEEQMNYDIRDESVRQLLVHADQMAEQFAARGIDGWIIAGDINTNHDGKFGDRVVEMFVEAGYWNTWEGVPPEERQTWKGRHERFEPSTLDYIFLKGLGQPQASMIWVDETVSDHNAVVVEVELPGAFDHADD